MRVALYARVSTERQERQGTIASQLDALRHFAQAHGHEVVDAYVCIDDGYSGSRLDRPGLDQLRDGAEAGAFEAALVLCPDRLARKYAYQVLILEELERFSVRVIFLEQPPSEDPHARLLVQIQGAIAEYERMKIAERYRRGKLFRARQGEVIFWKVPYGYRRIPRRDGVPAHVEIAEPEAPVVRQIFAWHVHDRLSVRQIALRLTESAHPTATGLERWGPSTVTRMLRNEAYAGTMYFNRHESLDGDAKTAGRRRRTKSRTRCRPPGAGCASSWARRSGHGHGGASDRQRCDGGRVPEELAPVFHGAIRSDQRGRLFVEAHDDFEEVLGRGVGQPLVVPNKDGYQVVAVDRQPLPRHGRPPGSGNRKRRGRKPGRRGPGRPKAGTKRRGRRPKQEQA
jgi:DNA invertase Pin-like site-specific DNA recombinase